MHEFVEIDIHQTNSTPGIRYKDGVLEIEGKVISINIAEFIQPLRKKLKDQEINKKKLDKISIYLRYVNSAGKRSIIEIFKQIKKLKNEGLVGEIVWKHDDEDEFIREFGEDIEEITNLRFHYHVV
ncbi:MAG: SiaC family regulatory phosphoprotein [Bacteroidota bacterium]